ncbi:cyclin-D3-3 [Humulus lupulus]|uniref:cyclin-D3-3 n=1 Tax=Humulus lupulus TaxID=3486 RepID=UPI002B403C2E|nr:cyclin-D3-3 [Humulus lupulus]
MALFDEAQDLQNPPMVLDALFCEEEGFEEEFGDNGIEEEEESENCDGSEKKQSSCPLVLLENDLFWEDDELTSLMSKEEQTRFSYSDPSSDDSLMAARKDAVHWIFTVKAHYGFSALTVVLAVNYYDRFISSFQFQKDKPWMSQLTAVACLSLAAKVEETDVPLLLGLQVEESRFVFEAKTVQRMELLVLSTLKWKMHPVTPISFFSHIVRRLGLKTHLHWEFLWRCERLLLSVIPDSRFACYLPSILATATMLHVINEIEPFNTVEYQNQLLNVLKISEERVNECYELMLETSGSLGCIQKQNYKRKHGSVPSSPVGVIDASFSSDTSNDSWAVGALVTRSLEPRFKRSRTQDQQMRLPPLNRFSVDVLSSPR